MLATAGFAGKAIVDAWEGDYGSAPCSLEGCACVVFPCPQQKEYDVACGVLRVNDAGATRLAVVSCLARRTSFALLVQQIYNVTRRTESGGEVLVGCRSLAWAVVVDARGQGGVDEVNMPYLSVCEMSLGDVFAKQDVLRCGSSSSWAVYASLDAQMASGCDGV